MAYCLILGSSGRLYIDYPVLFQINAWYQSEDSDTEAHGTERSPQLVIYRLKLEPEEEAAKMSASAPLGAASKLDPQFTCGNRRPNLSRKLFLLQVYDWR